MDLRRVKSLSLIEKQQIYKIWQKVYPKQSVHKTFAEFDNYINSKKNTDHYLILSQKKQLAAWLVIDNREDGKRWLVILVDTKFQKNGLGTWLLNEMKKYETEVSAWITPHNEYVTIDGSKYITPIKFYEKNGFAKTGDTFEQDGFSGVKITWCRFFEDGPE